MATITPTAPTFSDLVAAVVLATGAQGSRVTLDLKEKLGARLLVRIGRRDATALTVPGRLLIRPSHNDAAQHPTPVLDRVTGIAAAASTTLSSLTNIGDNTISVASATGLNAGDVLCLHSDDTNAQRVEFVDIDAISGTTITLRMPLKAAHNSGDRVTNQAEVFGPIDLPGGDVYGVRAVNQSGRSLLYEVKAIVLPGYTST